MGVKLGKIRKTMKEIERKTFHLCGILVPLIYALMLEYGFTKRQCVKVVIILPTSALILTECCDFSFVGASPHLGGLLI